MDTLPSDKPTFSVIMTTSYHGPYTVDLEKAGFPYKSINDFPEAIRKELDFDSMSLVEMGHLWYSDKAIGDFVRQMEAEFPKTLFALTGDHFGRRFINSNPSLYERSSVPFILYPKSELPSMDQPNAVGSHLDIAPTIVDIVAPTDFEYESLGKSMLRKDPQDIAYGYGTLLTQSAMYGLKKGRKPEVQPLTDEKERYSLEELEQMYRRYLGIHWEVSFKNTSMQALDLNTQ